jgi:hypothetical protein
VQQRIFEDKRAKPRRDLYYYLKVIGADDGKQLGRVVDLTTDGMLLVCNVPFEVGSAYSARIVLTGGLFNGKCLDVKFTTQWNKKDVNPSNFLNGVKFSGLDGETSNIIEKVINEIGVESLTFDEQKEE